MVPWGTIGYGVLGAVIGGTIVTLFSPVLQPVASFLNQKLWTTVGSLEPPDPEMYTLTDTNYQVGSDIGNFPDETWESSYKIVDFHIQNTSDRSLTNIQSFLSFDGIVVDSAIMDSSYRGVEIAPTSDAEYREHTGSTTIYGSGAHGAMNVFLDQLPSGRRVRVKFLIETDPDEKRIARPGDEDSYMSYRWRFHNVTYQDSQPVEDKSDNT